MSHSAGWLKGRTTWAPSIDPAARATPVSTTWVSRMRASTGFGESRSAKSAYSPR